jgi:hypothetical protein
MAVHRAILRLIEKMGPAHRLTVED